MHTEMAIIKLSCSIYDDFQRREITQFILKNDNYFSKKVLNRAILV